MGSSVSASKKLNEMTAEELAEGVKALSEEDQAKTGWQVVEVYKESCVRQAEVVQLKTKVAELEARLSLPVSAEIGHEMNEMGDARAALESGQSAAELVAAGHSTSQLKSARIEAAALRDAGFTAAQCKEGGYEASELYPLCRDFPMTKDPQYNKLSILNADGSTVLTATSYGVMQVASWSPDIYAAPPAWTRSEDGWDIRNKHKARMLEWARDEEPDEEEEEEEEDEEEEDEEEEDEDDE